MRSSAPTAATFDAASPFVDVAIFSTEAAHDAMTSAAADFESDCTGACEHAARMKHKLIATALIFVSSSRNREHAVYPHCTGAELRGVVSPPPLDPRSFRPASLAPAWVTVGVAEQGTQKWGEHPAAGRRNRRTQEPTGEGSHSRAD